MTRPSAASRALARLPLLALLASASPLFAQKPKETPPPAMGPYVKSVDVTITNIEVVVTDSKRNRVTGLTKNDFVVVEDGLEPVLTNFFAVDGGRLTMVGDEPVAAPAPSPALPADAAPVPRIPTPKTRMVIFVDNLHLTPFDRNRVLRNVEDFVKKSVKDDVEAMVVTWNRSLKIRRKFTNDGRDIADVLRQVEEESALGLTTLSERSELLRYIDDAQSADEAVNRSRSYALSLENDLQFTFDAMKTTINQLSGLEGRKIFIHVSNGLPQSPGAEIWRYIQDRFQNAVTMHQNFEFDKTQSYLGIIQAANSAGVTIYGFDATGLAVDTGVSAESRTTAVKIDTFTERTNLQSMISLMSEETGGKASLNRNDVTVDLKEIEKDTTSYYSLGYRSLRSGADRPHKVDVRMKRKGLVARARHSYLEKSPDTRVSEAVTSALFFSRDENPLGAGLEVGTAAPADRQNYLVPIRVRIPYARLAMIPDGKKVRGRVVLYFVVLDSAGKQSELARQLQPIEMDAKSFEKAGKSDFVYDVKLLMIPGGQKLSLAVRDDYTNTASYLQKSVFISALPPETPTPAPKP